MITTFAQNLIEAWRLGFVATADASGKPNVSPKDTFVVQDDRILSFAELGPSETISNINVSSDVEISFMDILTRRGVLIKGQARLIERGTGPYPALAAEHVRQWPDLAPHFSGLVVVDVMACKPIASPAYAYGATDEDMLEVWHTKIRNITINHKFRERQPC